MFPLRSLLILLICASISGAAVHAQAQDASKSRTIPPAAAPNEAGDPVLSATVPQHKLMQRSPVRRNAKTEKSRDKANHTRTPIERERNIIERQVKASTDAGTRTADKPAATSTPGAKPHSIGANAVSTGPAAAGAGAAGAGAGMAATAATATEPEPDADTWSAADISAAKARCDSVLKGIKASLTYDAPIKEGACGAPVIVELTKLGSGTAAVELSPPARLTCDMVAALDTWLREDIQPLARKHLGGPVVQMQTMSSYSCRNAYGRKLSRLSEHGRANALDIGGFRTSAGKSAYVLTSWGLTGREIKAIVAKAEAKRQADAKRQAEAAAALAAAQRSRGVPPGGGTAGERHQSAASSTAPAETGGGSRSSESSIGAFPIETRVEPLGMSPTWLGGPKSRGANPSSRERGEKAKPVEEIPESRRISFMREVHARACKHFGTVLGPEANNAHKNHFHIDMAERRRGNFCE